MPAWVTNPTAAHGGRPGCASKLFKNGAPNLLKGGAFVVQITRKVHKNQAFVAKLKMI
jgi:hypothetical protein